MTTSNDLSSSPPFIVVYGTLRQGMSAALPITNYVKTMTLPGYVMFDLGWFPGVVPTLDDRTIEVDIFKLPDNEEEYKQLIQRLDMYEGYNHEEPEHSLFRRATVETNDEEIGTAILYEYHNYGEPIKEYEVVKEGNWPAYAKAAA